MATTNEGCLHIQGYEAVADLITGVLVGPGSVFGDRADPVWTLNINNL